MCARNRTSSDTTSGPSTASNRQQPKLRGRGAVIAESKREPLDPEVGRGTSRPRGGGEPAPPLQGVVWSNGLDSRREGTLPAGRMLERASRAGGMRRFLEVTKSTTMSTARCRLLCGGSCDPRIGPTQRGAPPARRSLGLNDGVILRPAVGAATLEDAGESGIRAESWWQGNTGAQGSSKDSARPVPSPIAGLTCLPTARHPSPSSSFMLTSSSHLGSKNETGRRAEWAETHQTQSPPSL